MRLKRILVLLSMMALAQAPWSPRAHAMETDQFTLPPIPLKDISLLVETKFWDVIGKGLSKKNSEAVVPQEILYSVLSLGVPINVTEAWLLGTAKKIPNGQYQVSQKDSIYHWAHSPLPGSFLSLSPTVNLHGVYMGTDKVGHLTQQGYEYWRVYKKSLRKGLTEAEALERAIALGDSEELGIYGYGLSGVYSNGDLSANYAGFKFYLNLTEEVTVDGKVIPPILVLRNGKWEFNRKGPEGILEPFISAHLNEALNPSYYLYSRDEISRAVKGRCANWASTVPDFSLATVLNVLNEVKTWHGEEYGHKTVPGAR